MSKQKITKNNKLYKATYSIYIIILILAVILPVWGATNFKEKLEADQDNQPINQNTTNQNSNQTEKEPTDTPTPQPTKTTNKPKSPAN
ncbi:MAG: hypothetical protein LBC03_06655, partial [Nitrososphaerota archaeon]|nr:hypothetical protein [Nitrososphaerota archaeon]